MDYNSRAIPIVLNAWMLPSPIHHHVIFQALAALPPYHALMLVNNHDLNPLFYQLDAEQPGVFARKTVRAPRDDLFAVAITRHPKLGDITLLS